MTISSSPQLADKVAEMTLDIFRDPKRMVDDISALGLRHVGYGTPSMPSSGTRDHPDALPGGTRPDAHSVRRTDLALASRRRSTRGLCDIPGRAGLFQAVHNLPTWWSR